MADGERADVGVSGLLKEDGGEKSLGVGVSEEQPMDTAMSQSKALLVM